MSDEHIGSGKAHPVMMTSSGTSRPRRKSPSDAAFDLWLGRSLQNSYGEVANQPVPRELLDLIALSNPSC